MRSNSGGSGSGGRGGRAGSPLLIQSPKPSKLRYNKSGQFSITYSAGNLLPEDLLSEDETASFTQDQQLETPLKFRVNGVERLRSSSKVRATKSSLVISEGDRCRLEDLNWLLLDKSVDVDSFRRLLFESMHEEDLGLPFLRKSMTIICDKVMRRLLNLLGTIEIQYNEWERCEQSTIFGLPRYATEQSIRWWQHALTSGRSIYVHVEREIDDRLVKLKEMERLIASLAGRLFLLVSDLEEADRETSIRTVLGRCMHFLGYLMLPLDVKDASIHTPLKAVPLESKLQSDVTNVEICKAIMHSIDNLTVPRQNVLTSLNTLRRDHHFKRFWFQYSCLGLLGLAATNFLYSHSAYAGSPDLQRWKQVTHDKTNEFMNEHLVVPVRTIYSELFNQNSIDFDQMALEVQLNRESVAKMMNEFAKRKFTNPADLDKARKSIAGGDTQWMLEEHEKDVSSPWGALITGDLIQSLMIQLQKLKLEIDEEMLQMDKLIKANEINLQLAATFPILSLLYTGYQATLVFFRYWQHRNFRKLYGRNRPWSHASAQLRRIARILSMRQHTYVQEFYDQGYYLYGLMKLHEVATLELRGSERRQLLEDLADLRSLNLDTQAKLLVTNRMYRNFPHLFGQTDRDN